MESNAIDILNVSYGYTPSENILNKIQLSIQQSTITAIIGKSGSGKSTLLQIMNGMIQPSEGEVRLHGRPVAYHNIYPLRLQIGYVVQHVGLFPHMTVAENIGILGRIGKRPKQEIMNRIRELIEMVQLPEPNLNKYPHQLSGGEQQRAGICRALLLKPPILLMDEPFASLDNRTKKGIYQHLLDIQKKEMRTIVIVTHDFEETVALADRFIWIEEGKIKADGGRAELLNLKESYFSEAG